MRTKWLILLIFLIPIAPTSAISIVKEPANLHSFALDDGSYKVTWELNYGNEIPQSQSSYRNLVYMKAAYLCEYSSSKDYSLDAVLSTRTGSMTFSIIKTIDVLFSVKGQAAAFFGVNAHIHDEGYLCIAMRLKFATDLSAAYSKWVLFRVYETNAQAITSEDNNIIPDEINPAKEGFISINYFFFISSLIIMTVVRRYGKTNTKI